MRRSVVTLTWVDSPSATMLAVTVAAAVPEPRLSFPDASMTTRRAASSVSTKRPVPR
jgi:hypothetical protein